MFVVDATDSQVDFTPKVLVKDLSQRWRGGSSFGGRWALCHAVPAAVTDLTDSGSECGAGKVEKTPMKVLQKGSKRPMKKPSRPGDLTSHSL